jgi:hypothetical protein
MNVGFQFPPDGSVVGVKTDVHICSDLCGGIDDAKVSLYHKVVEYLV